MMELREGSYEAIAHSIVFPMLTPEVLMRGLDQRNQLGENAIVKQFRQWLRESYHVPR